MFLSKNQKKQLVFNSNLKKGCPVKVLLPQGTSTKKKPHARPAEPGGFLETKSSISLFIAYWQFDM